MPTTQASQDDKAKGLDQSHYIIDDEEVKRRNRNLFGGIMGYLKKAKTTLESEESKLRLQQQNFEKIDQRQEDQSRDIRDRKRIEIEEKRAAEIKKKREIETQLLKIDNDLLLKRLDTMYGQFGEFILTKTQPPIFWKPNKPRAEIEQLLVNSKKTVEEMKTKHVEGAKAIQDKLREDYLNYFNNAEEQDGEKDEEKEDEDEEVSESEKSKDEKRDSEENGSKKNDN